MTNEMYTFKKQINRCYFLNIISDRPTRKNKKKKEKKKEGGTFPRTSPRALRNSSNLVSTLFSQTSRFPAQALVEWRRRRII